jgi:hypothetical protein
MPFGLTNAPACHLPFRDSLRKLWESYFGWNIAMVYVDDIIVYSSSFDQHLMDIGKVVDKFVKKSKIQMNAS